MTIFKLNSLKLHNFLAIQDATISFAKPGLYLITGFNAKGGDSNGCGKTTILAGISYALFNRTPGGLKGAEVANWDSPDVYYVDLKLEGPDGIYCIHRGSDGLELTIDGKSHSLKGRKRDVQELINETFRTSEDIFFSSTLFTSNMSDYLSRMGDAAKKRLFKSILRLEKIDTAYAKAKTEYDRLNTVATSCEQYNTLLKDFIEEGTKEITILKQQVDDYEQSKKDKISAIVTSIGDPPIPTNLAFEVKAKQSLLSAVDATLEEVNERAIQINIDLSKAHERLGSVVNNFVQLEAQLKESIELEGATECDKCGGPLGDKYKTHMNELGEKISLNNEAETLIRTEIKKLESSLEGVSAYIDNFYKQKTELFEMQLRLEEEEKVLEEYRANKQNSQDRIRELQSDTNPFMAVLNTAVETYKAKQEQLAISEKAFDDAIKKMDLMSFLKFTFSREGVAAQIVERSFGSLQALANRFLSRICSEEMFINIVPQRELKSKALKEEIDIYITSGVPPRKMAYAALSGGQQQRVNIALLLALYKFCKNIGINDFDFILADEIFDLSLAEKGREDVINLMRDLLYSEVEQIIVISHQTDVSSNFDHQIVVNRDQDGISRVT